MEYNTIIIELLVLGIIAIPLLNLKLFNKNAICISLIFGIIILYLKEIEWFLILFTFLVTTLLATYISSKVRNVPPDSREVDNVLSNGLVPLITAIFSIKGDLVFFYIYLGSISAALADTLSSEIGMLSKGDPIMITTLRKTKKGENGGVSPLGFIAAGIGCFILATIADMLFNISTTLFITIIITGIIGTIIDSILGATLENKNMITNGSVNFITTLFGGITLIILNLLFI